MKRLLIGTMRLIMGAGVAIFLAFAAAATLLIFFQCHRGVLVVDRYGPDWGYGRIALVCCSAAFAWGLLWRRARPRKQGERTMERQLILEDKPLSIGFLTTAL
ncbi:MAG: hypothetical protein JO250_02075 [Armatimonadetes bacterium]|nr:hypothetical protein [Armatimonadota bacterium]